MKSSTFLIQIKNDLWNERLKFLILLFLFIFQVISSIIAIFYMEELLAFFNFEFINPIPPSGEAAFLDFLNDQFIFGILIMSLGTMSIFATEIENNSISYSLTRPISRTEYSTARIIARLIALISPLILATILGWLYMALIFEIFPLDRLIGSLIFMVLLYIYLGIVTCALSTRVSALTAGLAAITIYIAQITITIFKPIELLSPFVSANLWQNYLLNNPVPTDEVLIKLSLLVFWILIPFILGIYSIRKRDL